MRGRGAGIQGATSAFGRGGRAAGGHRMIPKDCKRLAEVDLPVAEVSRHAAREKSIRHGDPGTLHLLRTDPQTENNRRKEGPDE